MLVPKCGLIVLGTSVLLPNVTIQSARDQNTMKLKFWSLHVGTIAAVQNLPLYGARSPQTQKHCRRSQEAKPN